MRSISGRNGEWWIDRIVRFAEEDCERGSEQPSEREEERSIKKLVRSWHNAAGILFEGFFFIDSVIYFSDTITYFNYTIFYVFRRDLSFFLDDIIA